MRLKIFYSIADQSFESTKSLGIFNASVAIAQTLGELGDEVDLRLASNSQIGELGLSDECVSFHDQPILSKWGRILWDQIGVCLAARRSESDWMILPKGFAPLWVTPPCRLAIYIHDTMTEYYRIRYPRCWNPLEVCYFHTSLRASLRRASVIFTNSEFSRSEIIRFARMAKISSPPVKVVGLGFHKQTIRWEEKRPEILVITGAHPHKRVDLAIQYLQEWQEKTGNTRTLHWVGKFPKGIRLPKLPNWKGYGRLSDQELQELFVRCQAVVYFSEYEGFGMPPVEAMLSGAAPVYSDIPAMSEIMEGSGFSFSNESSESFFSALDAALSADPTQLNSWAESLAVRHHWPDVVSRMLDALKE